MRNIYQRLASIAAVAVLLVTGCNQRPDAPEAGPAAKVENVASRKKIVFFGDSLTAGHSLDRSQAFPALLQRKIDEAKLPFEAVNAGSSGDTTADGLRRFDWALSGGADLLVLELGANDGLRGLDLDACRKNLAEILTRARSRRLPTLLVGMKVPPNYGPPYSARFEQIFESLAKEFAVPLVPFLLEGVGGVPELTLPDGIHPNAQGQVKMAETVWKALEPILRSLAAVAG